MLCNREMVSIVNDIFYDFGDVVYGENCQLYFKQTDKPEENSQLETEYRISTNCWYKNISFQPFQIICPKSMPLAAGLVWDMVCLARLIIYR